MVWGRSAFLSFSRYCTQSCLVTPQSQDSEIVFSPNLRHKMIRIILPVVLVNTRIQQQLKHGINKLNIIYLQKYQASVIESFTSQNFNKKK